MSKLSWVWAGLVMICLVACSAGPMGPPGQDGEMGVVGEPGKDGVDGNTTQATHVSESIFCNGKIGTSTYFATYNVILFSSGDMFVTGSIENQAIQVSTTTIYTQSQNGYQTAPVLVKFDAQDPADSGYWRLSLDRQAMITYVEYMDADLPNNLAWALPVSACVHNIY